MNIYDCDAYWLRTVAGIDITEDEVREMDALAAAIRQAWKEYDQAPKTNTTATSVPYGRRPLLTREECEERSRRKADLVIFRTAADTFVVQALSSAAQIAFSAYLSAHAIPSTPHQYSFRVQEVGLISRLVISFRLTCTSLGPDGQERRWGPDGQEWGGQ